MDVLHVFRNGDTVLISTFVLLFLMSVISWSIIIVKVISIKQVRTTINNFLQEYDSTNILTSLNKSHTMPIKTIIDKTVSVKTLISSNSVDKNTARDIISMHLVQSLDTIRCSIDANLTTLASIASSSPFVGLFGTVWGVYNALTDISLNGNVNIDIVAGPMGEALVATAFGLFTAVPAVLSYNAFMRINKLIVQDLRHISERLTIYLTI